MMVRFWLKSQLFLIFGKMMVCHASGTGSGGMRGAVKQSGRAKKPKALAASRIRYKTNKTKTMRSQKMNSKNVTAPQRELHLSQNGHFTTGLERGAAPTRHHGATPAECARPIIGALRSPYFQSKPQFESTFWQRLGISVKRSSSKLVFRQSETIIFRCSLNCV